MKKGTRVATCPLGVQLSTGVDSHYFAVGKSELSKLSRRGFPNQLIFRSLVEDGVLFLSGVFMSFSTLKLQEFSCRIY
jgi:hypothetical protein